MGDLKPSETSCLLSPSPSSLRAGTARLDCPPCWGRLQGHGSALTRQPGHAAIHLLLHPHRRHHRFHGPVLRGRERQGSFEDHVAPAVTRGQHQGRLESHQVSPLSLPAQPRGLVALPARVPSARQSCGQRGVPGMGCPGTASRGVLPGCRCCWGSQGWPGTRHRERARSPYKAAVPARPSPLPCPRRVGINIFTRLRTRKEGRWQPEGSGAGGSVGGGAAPAL